MHVVVVAESGVHHLRALRRSRLSEVGADLGVAALDLVVGGLADVVQQAAPPGQVAVQADLFGHHAGQKRHLDRVPQHVLAVAGAELQPAEQLDDLLVQARHVGLLGGLLADLADDAAPSRLRFP